MAVLTYAQLKTAASDALGAASTAIQSYLDRQQLNAAVVELLLDLKVDVDADKSVVDAATEV